MTPPLPIQQLEQYTLQHPQEVLIVRALVGEATDEVVVFRGFSSSLVRPTAPDPETPVLPADANIQGIDRLQGPYTPDNPKYLEQDIPWQMFADRLDQLGL